MYRRMLIPLDGSKSAEQILPYARFLAKSLEIPVELLAVIDVYSLAPLRNERDEDFLRSIIEKSVLEAKHYLEGVARSLPGITTYCFVEKGKPAEVIIEKAADDKETLVAMATHGRSGINRWILGSVAEKILRAATNPLLLVRAGEDLRIDGEATLKSIVVPLDGSKFAETVLPGVVELAKKMNLEVILARAYSLPMAAYSGDDYFRNYEEIRMQTKEEARGYLENKINKLKKEGLEKVSSVLLEGSAAEEIIGFARTTPDNFIAICTHGRSGVKRWVLGSVTEKVVRHSGNPVLVISANTESRSLGRSVFPVPGEEVRNALRYTID